MRGIGEKERKILKRGLLRSNYSCPHCGHQRAIQKIGSVVHGWFCGKCGKKNKGTETYKNKHGVERTRAKL